MNGSSTKLNLFMVHVKRFINAVLSSIADLSSMKTFKKKAITNLSI